MSSTLKDKIIHILVEQKMVSQDQLNKALEIQKKDGGRLSDILVKEKFVGQRELMAALSQQLGFPPMDITRFKLDPQVVGLVPKDVCNFYQVLPLAKIGNLLSIAMADPLNVFAMDDIKLTTGMEINPVIVRQEDLMKIMKEYFIPKTNIESILKETTTGDVVIAEERGEEIDISSLMEQSKEAPVVKLVNAFLVQAVRDRASDIHIEPFEKNIRIRFRMDGVLNEIPSPPRNMHNAIVSRIKILSRLDIAERRLPQDGRFRIKLDEREVDFRVSVLPSSYGEKVVMRILDKSAVAMRLSALGFDEIGLNRFKDALDHPHGMILLTGPTGSGKTTTLYSAVNEINKPDLNIVTIEDPVEYQLYGVTQVQVNPDIGLTFSAGLRSILRQDPDVILVGEIRDFETADIAIKAALTGHLVLSTLHTNDAAGAITRLVDMGIEPFLVASSLLMTAAQRLVRRICPKCSAPITVDPAVLEQAQMKIQKGDKISLARGKGCYSCKKTGYSGRMSLLEVLTLNEELIGMIVRKANSLEIKNSAIRNGTRTLRQVGLDQVKKGLTTLEEVLRVTAPD